MNANEVQIGGDHYRSKPIQCWDFIVAQQLEYLPGCVVKYVSRYREKNGLQDLKKARHYLDKLIEVEEEKGKERTMESGYFLFNTMTHKIFGTTSYATPEEAQKAIEDFELKWQDNPKDRRDLAVVSVRYDEVVGVPKEEVSVQEPSLVPDPITGKDMTSGSIIPAPVLKRDSGFGHPLRKDVTIGEGIAEHLNHHKQPVGTSFLVEDVPEGAIEGYLATGMEMEAKMEFGNWYIIDRKTNEKIRGPFVFKRIARAEANLLMESSDYKTAYPDGLKVEER